MTEIEQKIEQCKKDIETLNKNLTELENEKAKKVELVPGDIAIGNYGQPRLIIHDGHGVISVNIDGGRENEQANFELQKYRKVGRISDFIKGEK